MRIIKLIVRKKHFHIIFVSLMFLLSAVGIFSCNLGEKSVEEGEILYKITYPAGFEDKWMERLMPKEMNFYFNTDYVKTEMIFGLGMIQINYLADNQNKTLNELLKFMKKKSVAYRDSASINDFLKTLPKHNIQFLPDTLTIAGFLCKKAIVQVEDSVPYTFDCWYTNQIKINRPNWCTPFKEIDGVLMQYQVKRFNILMEFKAQNVEMLKQEQEVFVVPENYISITPEEMQRSLAELQEF